MLAACPAAIEPERHAQLPYLRRMAIHAESTPNQVHP